MYILQIKKMLSPCSEVGEGRALADRCRELESALRKVKASHREIITALRSALSDAKEDAKELRDARDAERAEAEGLAEKRA
jgi:peptidoglycan hydrolase CwlO-like protein